MAESNVAGTAAFSKFMAVMQAVADAAEPPSVAALVRACGYPRPTVYRIVAALTEQGMLAETAGVYRLGTRLLSLASRAWSQFDLRQELATELHALRDATGETVHLSVPAGTEMIYIEKLESPGPVRMVSRIGSAVALHSSAVGKAYLAALDAATRKQVVSRLPIDIGVSLSVLDAEIARVQRMGYAIDNEENEAGIVCYGVALCDASGTPVAGVSVSTLRFRQQDDVHAAYIEPLLRLRAAASQKLATIPVQHGFR